MAISIIEFIGSVDNITLAAWNLLIQADCVYTAAHNPALEEKLLLEGRSFKNCQELAPEERAEEILLADSAREDVVYIAETVPAQMDRTVGLLAQRAQLFPQPGLHEVILAKLGLDARGAVFLNSQNAEALNPKLTNLIWGPLDAQALKTIEERYQGAPEGFRAKLCFNLGSFQERIEEVSLGSLSKIDSRGLCCLVIPSCEGIKSAGEKIMELERVMAKLRGGNGCPWDREQTLDSLQPYLIEEAYEVLDALAGGDPVAHCEELGDVLLQIVFQSRIAAEEGKFCLADVIAAETAKMIRRHPHVFGDVDVASVEGVLDNWEKIKAKEREGKMRKSLLDGVPGGLPALARAYKFQEKAARVGFQWDEVGGALEKANEELLELVEAIESGDEAAIEEEFGDLFFALVNVARYLDVYPEVALNKSVNKFESRFRYIEEHANLPLEQMTLQQMDRLWDEAKALE